MFCASLLRAKQKLQPSSHLAMAVAVLIVFTGILAIGIAIFVQVKTAVAQLLLRQAFTESVATGQPVKPWGWRDGWPVARLDVPRLGVEAIVLKGGSGKSRAFGLGLVENAPEPGDEGVAVISAYRGAQLAFLRGVKLGDEIQVSRRDGAIFWFRISDKTVERWNASGGDPQATGRWLLLATPWPLDATVAGDLCLVVRARMIGRQTSQRSQGYAAPL